MARSPGRESESETRRTRVDPKLAEQGWEVVPFRPNAPVERYARHAVTEFPTANGPVDYALFIAGQSLIVERTPVVAGPQGRTGGSSSLTLGSPCNSSDPPRGRARWVKWWFAVLPVGVLGGTPWGHWATWNRLTRTRPR